MGRPAFGVRGMELAAKDYIVGMAVTPKQVFTAEQRRRPGARTKTSRRPSRRFRT